MKSRLLCLESLEPFLAAPSESNDDELYQTSRLSKILALLPKIIEQELTQRQRKCVQLYYFENKTMVEIGKELQVQTPAVSRTLQRARKKVERILRYQFL
jgi:RNA polymerase sigma factor (sigma-70 family)